MVSERVQRRIEQFLDEAEEALAANNWDTAEKRAEAVLSLDPENQDAATSLGAVDPSPYSAEIKPATAPR